MKAIKYVIVSVLVAALSFGGYKIVNPENGGHIVKTDSGTIEIPEGCDLDWDQQYIDSVYRTIPNGQFKTLKQRRSEMAAHYNKVMVNMPQKCKETVDLILRNRYQARFVNMATSEFEGKNWPHYSDIRDMNLNLLTELSQGSEELKKIKSICAEYGQVIYYNSRVKNQSCQQPTSINSHWNFSNTRNIISTIPSASAPVSHTTQYDSSRQGNVKNSLYMGHVAFLEKLVDLARQQIMDERNESNFNRVFDITTKEIDLFKANAASLYDKGNSSVNSTAERLTNQIKGFEGLLN